VINLVQPALINRDVHRVGFPILDECVDLGFLLVEDCLEIQKANLSDGVLHEGSLLAVEAVV